MVELCVVVSVSRCQAKIGESWLKREGFVSQLRYGEFTHSVSAILFEVPVIQVQEEIHHFAGWEVGDRGAPKWCAKQELQILSK